MSGVRGAAVWAWVWLVALAGGARGQGAADAYAGMIPAPGDAHRHTGVAESLRELAICGGHTFGLPQRVYTDAAAAGYKWLNASHHDFQVSSSLQSPVYQWWISRTDADDIVDRQGRKWVDFPMAGFPDWSDPLGLRTVVPGHREALSLFSATSRAPAGFAAFSGLEYTPYAVQGPSSSGHLLALLPGPVERACALPPSSSAGSAVYTDASEYCPRALDFYLWLKQRNGVGIAAHPTLPVEVLDPRTRPNGLSDLFLEGHSVGLRTIYGDEVFRAWTWRGFRMFPSVDSDLHKVGCEQFVVGGDPGVPPAAADGATVCWVADPQQRGSVTRGSVLEAMRARRCYAAAPGFPTLKLDTCPDWDIAAGCRVAPRPMGSLVTPGALRAVSAPVYFHWETAHGCRGDEPDRDGDAWPDCPDNCPARANPDQRESGAVPDGLGDACDPDDDGDGLCDPDADPLACLANLQPGMDAALCTACSGRDSCPQTADAPARDSDADGVFDSCDVCPARFDPAQADRDADGVGDACDNCLDVVNPRAPTWARPELRTSVGGQLDDDADGLGNACDLDLDGNGSVERCELASAEFAALTGRSVGEACDDQCRPPGQIPCAVLDVNGRDLEIGGPQRADAPGDLEWARWLLFNPQLRSSCCAPPFARGECSGPVCDSDRDGVLDDGDGSGIAGDRPCLGPQAAGCDDNCPEIPNPDQAADVSRIGRACRCGDLSGDGRLTAADFGTCVFDPTRPRCAEFCDMNGDGRCDVVDTPALRMAIYGRCVPVCSLYSRPLAGIDLPLTGGRPCP